MSERGDEDKSGGDEADAGDALSKRASVDDGAHGDDGDDDGADVAQDGRGATDGRADADGSDAEASDADESDADESDADENDAEESDAEESDAEESDADQSDAESGADDSDAEESDGDGSDGEESDGEESDGGGADGDGDADASSGDGRDGDSSKAADSDDAPSSPLSKLWWLLPIAVVVEFWIYGHNGYIDVCVGKEGETDFALAGKERTDENRWKFPRCETRLNLGLRGEFEAKKAEATKVACRGATLFKNRGQAAQCEAAKDGWTHQVDARFCPPWDPNYYEHLFWFLK